MATTNSKQNKKLCVCMYRFGGGGGGGAQVQTNIWIVLYFHKEINFVPVIGEQNPQNDSHNVGR